MEESNSWFQAQEVPDLPTGQPSVPEIRPKLKWKHPPDPWLKCNIGFSWSDSNCLGGAAWVLRDAEDTIILRRSFSQTCSLKDANFFSILWTLDSMKAHRFDNIIFEVEAAEFIGAINRPKVWPSFHYQTGKVCYKLKAFNK